MQVTCKRNIKSTSSAPQVLIKEYTLCKLELGPMHKTFPKYQPADFNSCPTLTPDSFTSDLLLH